jgi:hypothetical protein
LAAEAARAATAGASKARTTAKGVLYDANRGTGTVKPSEAADGLHDARRAFDRAAADAQAAEKALADTFTTEVADQLRMAEATAWARLEAAEKPQPTPPTWPQRSSPSTPRPAAGGGPHHR